MTHEAVPMGSATTRYEKLTNNVPMVSGFGAATFPMISSGTNSVSLHE